MPESPVILQKAALADLITALKSRGFRVLGPRAADGAIIYDDLDGMEDLPAGLTDEQKGGHYRLKPSGDQSLFAYTTAPQGWKRFLYPPKQKLFSATRQGGGFTIDPPPAPEPPLAFIGARACELAAIAIQAKVLADDPGYQDRLARAFIVAVQCTRAGDTCFCQSMGTGPEVKSGFDLKLVETPDGFVAEAGSERGGEILAGLGGNPGEMPAAAPLEMGRVMATDTARDLQHWPEHPRWAQVAERCLTCANCTMVCPTCFCTTVEDVTDLKGDHAERWRKWDSCFTLDFSYIHGGPVRTEARSRYRQWITHKLSTWFDQFGSSGCVGCGRCITWCPVGIDITEEVQAIHQGRT